MKFRRDPIEAMMRLALFALILVELWIFLGRPRLQLHLYAVARKALGVAAAAASDAHRKLGDAMIDLATTTPSRKA